MATKKRKIAFYILNLESGEIDIKRAFNETIEHIDSLENPVKKISLGNNKFGYLANDNIFDDDNQHQIIFKSATSRFRPPLIDEQTVEERESPKRITEGEVNKTHIVTKYVNGDIIFLTEKYMDGLNMNQIIYYLNNFVHFPNLETPVKFGYDIIAKEDFLEEINNLDRITCAELYVEKQILGSEAMNFSNRISTAKQDVVVSVKAKNKDSIKNIALDAYEAFTGNNSVINKIKIIGKNQDNNVVKINTSFIEKQEYVTPEMNEITGVVETNDILVYLDEIISNYR